MSELREYFAEIAVYVSFLQGHSTGLLYRCSIAVLSLSIAVLSMEFPSVRTPEEIQHQKDVEAKMNEQMDFTCPQLKTKWQKEQLERVRSTINQAFARKEQSVIFTEPLYPENKQLLEEKGYQCIIHRYHMNRTCGDVTIYFDYDAERKNGLPSRY